MKFPRRKFLRLAVGAAALPGVSRIAKAQSYPAKPVRLIVGFGAGGAADIIARLIGQWLAERLGQPFIVENRLGGASNLATEAVVRSPPDGYTLLMVSPPQAINATLYDKLAFNFVRDIAPVGSIFHGTGAVMEVNPSFPAKTVPEFIAYAKSNPNKINMASAGIGSVNHIYGELFKMMTDVKMVHVPYRSTIAPLTDLMGGQVHVTFDALASSIEYIRTGKLRALGVTSATRIDSLPDIPAIGEFVPGYEATGFLGIVAPKNTDPEIITRLNRELNAGLVDPKIKGTLASMGYAVSQSSPAEFAKLLADQTEKWRKVIRAANMKPE
jgi:tripartite-type tricarboxylate transporter receptor subunit TctC